MTDRPTDRPTTDRPRILEISNGHISATDHPIHFMFDSTVGFSRSADTSGWTKSKIAAVSRLV